MKHIKLYEEFISNIRISYSDNDMQFEIFSNILLDYDIEDSIKIEINNFLKKSDILLNENFFNNFKQFFSKAARETSELSSKAENVIKIILQKSKDALSLIKKLGEEIRIFFKKIIENTKAHIIKNIEILKKKIDELYKLKKEGIIKDFKTIVDVIEFYRKTFLLELNNSLDKNLTNFFSKEQELLLAESFILEKNVIFKFVHGITKIPPFSWLEDLAKLGELGATKMIEQISDLTTKLGGSSFTLPVVALIIGEVFEYTLKSWTMPLVTGVEIIQSSGFDVILNGISKVAMFVSIMSIIESTIGEKISKEEQKKDL